MSEPEWRLLLDLARRPGRYELGRSTHGPGIGYLEVLCQTDAERVTFAGIMSKADAPFPAQWGFYVREGYGLDALFADLCL